MAGFNNGIFQISMMVGIFSHKDILENKLPLATFFLAFLSRNVTAGNIRGDLCKH